MRYRSFWAIPFIIGTIAWSRWSPSIIISLDRAIEIALLLRNDDLQDKAYGAIIDHLNALRQGGHVRWYLELAEIFVTFGRDKWNEDDTALAIESLEEGAAYYEDSGNFHLQREFQKILARIKRDINENNEAKEIERRICQSSKQRQQRTRPILT